MGQDFPNPRQVVILIEDENGYQHGWRLDDATLAKWDWLGIGGRGSRARVTVEGTFQRMTRVGERAIREGIAGLMGPSA